MRIIEHAHHEYCITIRLTGSLAMVQYSFESTYYIPSKQLLYNSKSDILVNFPNSEGIEPEATHTDDHRDCTIT